MSTLPRAVFAALVAATFGAFFVAQRLKNEPTIIQNFYRTPVFSPNGDGRLDRAKLTFLLKQADRVDVDLIGPSGDSVRGLARGRQLEPYRAVDLKWDGTDDSGRPVPDGIYRARLTLRREGRSIVVPKSVRKDTRPPRPRVLSIGPETAEASELLPTASGQPARIGFDAPGRVKRVTIWRTDGAEPQRVTSSNATPLAEDATSWSWNGEVDGRRVRPGTYLAVAESRDEAGNVGFSVPMRDGRPRIVYGRKLPGRAGITVRYLSVQPPSEPVVAGEPADVFIDARGAPWRYTLRRVGEANVIRRSEGSGTRPRLRLRTPRATGIYLLEVRTRTRAVRVPLVVQANEPVGRVLVVLPWMTWQGRNLVDDDGDGRPNTLEGGVGVRADRVFAGDGLPVDFATREAPVLGFLDRTRRAYDLTTDIALARAAGPKLDEFAGVLIPGDARWLTARLGAQLRRFVRRGGTVVSLGTDSLRRQVELAAAGKRLVRPTNATRADLFGAVLRPLVRTPTDLTVAEDRIELFAGDEGLFPGVTAYEATGRLDDATELAADAVTREGRPVIVAARTGRGLVVRTGIPDFAQRLTPRPESAALMNRLWALLRSGAPR